MLDIYGSFGIVAGISQILYLTAAFLLAGHLLLRARQSRELPEFLLGLHLLLAMGVGYLLISMGVVAAQHAAAPPREVIAFLIGAGYFATILGLIATLIFNYRVFRPGSRRALAFIWLVIAAMGLGWAGYGLSGEFGRARFAGTWQWIMIGGILAANLWVALEPLFYRRRLLRRLHLGLAEPLVVDRFLLWGCGSLTRTAMVVAGGITSLVEHHTVLGPSLPLTVGVLVFASACGLFTAVAYWLTFFPTQRYTRWVTRRYASSAS
jgi:hypothetical protein